jgi:hypothetical protein
MKETLHCIEEDATLGGQCYDYHEGLCMATGDATHPPKKISRMRKCPYED